MARKKKVQPSLENDQHPVGQFDPEPIPPWNWIRGYPHKPSCLPGETARIHLSVGNSIEEGDIRFQLLLVRVGGTISPQSGPTDPLPRANQYNISEEPFVRVWQSGVLTRDSSNYPPYEPGKSEDILGVKGFGTLPEFQTNPVEIPVPEANWPDLDGEPVDVRLSGFYELLAQKQGHDEYCRTGMFLIVRPKPDVNATNRILMILTNTTWQAYNSPGWSYYKQGYDPAIPNGFLSVPADAITDLVYSRRGDGVTRTSFNRPIFPGNSFERIQWKWNQGATYWYWTRSEGSFDSWEKKFIAWAESVKNRLLTTKGQQPYVIDYCSNTDLEFHPDVLDGVRLVVSVGHDEYWSAPMRDAIDAFLKTGGNVAFLSGNVCARKVKFEQDPGPGGREPDEDLAMICYHDYWQNDPASAIDLSAVTGYWDNPHLKRPENLMTGLGFFYGGHPFLVYPKHRNYRVFRGMADHPIFCKTESLSSIAGFGDYFEFGDDDTYMDNYYWRETGIITFEVDGCSFSVESNVGRGDEWKAFLKSITGPDDITDDKWNHFGVEVNPTLDDGAFPNLQILAGCFDVDRRSDEGWGPYKNRFGIAAIVTQQQPGMIVGGKVVSVGSVGWVNGLSGGCARRKEIEMITRNVIDWLME